MYNPLRSSRVLQRALSSTVASTVQARSLATVAPNVPLQPTAKAHRVVVIGGGAAGLSVSHMLLRSGKFAAAEIAIVDPAGYHHYQPGWTLVGGGLKTKEQLQRPLESLVDPNLRLYQEAVAGLQPEQNTITLSNGDALSYDHLVIAPGVKIDLNSIDGLQDALMDPTSLVCSIYTYETCDKVFRSIQKLKKGKAIFTQPAGLIKCAGAPQKIMWLALDHWEKQSIYQSSQTAHSPVKISFATGLPVMFGVPKYSRALNKLREQRGVEAMFEHDLVSIKGNLASFKSPHSKELVERPFDFLHVAPKMGPHKFVSDSVLSNESGYVNINTETLNHKDYKNVWGIGDAAALPTSKTAAAITAQAPVLVSNLLQAIGGFELSNKYDGYTSCPLTTGNGKVMLAEFKYGPEPYFT
ncbi:hypothetical protein LTR84_006848 [Exophiala bonariae]|uniref:FAD/NAD(P)-binding domain-containing protein n=1 Tax=Exophiala bonariae TaxID=1690606 RepID=A0AAV9N193_9EURO|nr:hypothetical protein LTR84_006848 [Exophiala bonariae]